MNLSNSIFASTMAATAMLIASGIDPAGHRSSSGFGTDVQLAANGRGNFNGNGNVGNFNGNGNQGNFNGNGNVGDNNGNGNLDDNNGNGFTGDGFGNGPLNGGPFGRGGFGDGPDGNDHHPDFGGL